MQTDQKKAIFFFSITFGMPILMGIFLGIAYGHGQDVTAFPLAWMFFPATAVMIGSLFVGEEKPDGRGGSLSAPRLFYGFFSLLAILMTVVTAAAVFVPALNAPQCVNFLTIIASLVSLPLLLFMKKAKREAFGLCLFRNAKKSLLGILAFVALYLAMIAVNWGIALLAGTDLAGFSFNPDWGLWLGLLLPITLVTSFAAYFGEEYGWRYYLMPLLQNKFGMKKGVLLLGILWGLWHVPLNLFYYSPSTSVQSILVQLAGCVGMGIFFGWVYLRTQNIWAVTVIHFLNNNLGLALFLLSPQNVERQWGDTLLTIALYMLVYLPFLFTREYQEKETV